MALTGTVARPGAEPATPRALARGRTEGLSPDDARALWPSLAERALSDNAFFDRRVRVGADRPLFAGG
jgi:hypothetical protein